MKDAGMLVEVLPKLKALCSVLESRLSWEGGGNVGGPITSLE